MSICSAARARRYLQYSGTGYLACLIDTRTTERMKEIENVHIVRDFPNVFPDELSGVPPERQVDFHIDLVPSAALVARHPTD